MPGLETTRTPAPIALVVGRDQAATTKTPTITKHYDVVTSAIQANSERTVPVTVKVTNRRTA